MKESDLQNLNERFGITEHFICNGCEHGFKPSNSCPNEDCADCRAHVTWDKLCAAVREQERQEARREMTDKEAREEITKLRAANAEMLEFVAMYDDTYASTQTNPSVVQEARCIARARAILDKARREGK